MPGVALEDSAEHLLFLTGVAKRAAGRVRSDRDSIHVGEFRQAFGRKPGRDMVANRRTAIHASQNLNVISRADLAVWSHESLPSFLGGNGWLFRGSGF